MRYRVGFLLVFQLYRLVNAMPYTEFTSTVISSYPNEDVLDGYIVIVSDFESGSFPLSRFALDYVDRQLNVQKNDFILYNTSI